MTALHIQITWYDSDEYIDLDTEDLPEVGAVLQTADYWRTERRTVTYLVRCQRVSLVDDTLRLDLSYAYRDNRDNPDLDDPKGAWGHSSIELEIDKRRGQAQWTDDHDDERNGAAKEIVFLDSDLTRDLSYRQTSVLERVNQIRTKQALLKKYGRCALSGENLHAVLDLAHLIAAKNRGAASMSNCLLLRTDLHRLLDSGLLRFDAAGKAVLAAGVSERYRTELAHAALAPAVLADVEPALRQGELIA